MIRNTDRSSRGYGASFHIETTIRAGRSLRMTQVRNPNLRYPYLDEKAHRDRVKNYSQTYPFYDLKKMINKIMNLCEADVFTVKDLEGNTSSVAVAIQWLCLGKVIQWAGRGKYTKCKEPEFFDNVIQLILESGGTQRDLDILGFEDVTVVSAPNVIQEVAVDKGLKEAILNATSEG